MTTELPKDLRQLVRETTDTLGQVIADFEGKVFFEKVESYRSRLKELRIDKDHALLKKLLEEVESEKPKHRLKLAHSFALLMELINCAEAAYRTWRLQARSPVKTTEPSKDRVPLNFVLTSHPTEARSPKTVDLINEIIGLLTAKLQHPSDWNNLRFETCVRQLWQLPLSKQKKPDVKEEASFIFSLIFRDEILRELVREDQAYEFRLRTWVGGDKDGHPGVNEKVMLKCLSLSRRSLLKFVGNAIRQLQNDLRIVGQSSLKLNALKKEAAKLQRLGPGDGARLARFRKTLKQILKTGGPFIQKHEALVSIDRLLRFTPALVLPIELREDSGEIALALEKPRMAISNMLSTLAKLSKGSDIRDYAKGFVISHCESAGDIENAIKLNRKCTGSHRLPVVPLFESRQALVNGTEILSTWLGKEKNLKLVQGTWNNKLEIMLGYSDSAKETGVLASRRLIQKSMGQMEAELQRRQVEAVFFHGSGGSVARGGGSLKEQIIWWPNAAIRRPKMTIQGEMIQRTFATVEIMNSNASAMATEAQARMGIENRPTESKALDRLMELTQSRYREFVEDKEFLGKCLSATPFDYLQVLKIGSRPAKRKAELSLDSLRAIPWVLCWTQARILLPTWWGLGSAWGKLSDSEKQELRELHQNDSFFSSFIKTIGFSLAKVELPIWSLYLERAHGEEGLQMAKVFEMELKGTMDFIGAVSGKEDLLWHRPWLGESIQLRAPYIHLLNLLQIVSMNKKDEALLRKTIVGIASGMLTTG